MERCETEVLDQGVLELNRDNHNQVKQAIVLQSARARPEPAHLRPGPVSPASPGTWCGPNGRPNSWGGHYVLVPGYTTRGPVCVTWGTKHQMTWAFFDKYCDEAYAIIDAIDTPKKKKALDSKALAAFLGAL